MVLAQHPATAGEGILAPGFDPRFKAEASSQVRVLDALRAADTSADWFYLSPPTGFGAHVPDERTGSYRTGNDVLLTNDAGKSEIGGADFAIAVIDEIERPKHHKARFTVAY